MQRFLAEKHLPFGIRVSLENCSKASGFLVVPLYAIGELERIIGGVLTGKFVIQTDRKVPLTFGQDIRYSFAGMKLSPKQAKILSFAQLDSRLSAIEIARGTGLREHSVVFGLRSLLKANLIRPFVLSNLHGLGLTDYCVFLSYSGKERGARTKILKYCIASPRTAYVAELSGEYQFSISIFARSIFEIEDFFAELSKIVPDSSLSLNFAIRCEWSVLPRRYFDSGMELPSPLRRTRMPLVKVDDVDLRVLVALGAGASESIGKLARQIGIPETTFRHRVKGLEKNGIIVGYPYEVDVSRLGLCPLRILIVAQDKSKKFRDDLFNFVKSHPRATQFVRCLGSWDFEINFDLKDLHEGVC